MKKETEERLKALGFKRFKSSSFDTTWWNKNVKIEDQGLSILITIRFCYSASNNKSTKDFFNVCIEVRNTSLQLLRLFDRAIIEDELFDFLSDGIGISYKRMEKVASALALLKMTGN